MPKNCVTWQRADGKTPGNFNAGELELGNQTIAPKHLEAKFYNKHFKCFSDYKAMMQGHIQQLRNALACLAKLLTNEHVG